MMPILTVPADSVRAGSPESSARSAPHYATWQAALRDAVRDPAELAALLGLPDADLAAARQAAGHFKLLVPRGFVAKMRPGDRRDPLLLQVWPDGDELQSPQGFTDDPVGDSVAALQPGLLHKYAGRVLMVATGACAVHCRYCFRRHFPYAEAPKSPAAWQPALDRVAADSSIREVLLSGGDPLMLVDGLLGDLAGRIAALGHVRRLRIHTRLPIVLPERVTEELLAWLRGTRLAPLVVVHANHPREIDGPVVTALARLVESGVPVLNQAVLLRGVNDNVESLAELSERLIDARVMPYYLHQLDRVAGAAHFEVSEERGRELVAELRRRLPGYAVPRYVREVPGAASKVGLEWLDSASPGLHN